LTALNHPSFRTTLDAAKNCERFHFKRARFWRSRIPRDHASAHKGCENQNSRRARRLNATESIVASLASGIFFMGWTYDNKNVPRKHGRLRATHWTFSNLLTEQETQNNFGGEVRHVFVAQTPHLVPLS
jgi:hypothetical protein